MTREGAGHAPAVRPVRYGVIPAGGLGTRFLPISRAVPKELIPIVDTPVIDLVVTEMTASGIERVVLVVGPGKEWIEAYFKPNPRIEARLAADMRREDLELLKRAERLAQVKSVLQAEPNGNGHAVLQARPLVGSRYGVVAGTEVDDQTRRVIAIVEKPAPEDAPSDLAAVHGYLLEPEIFDALAKQPPGRGGEVWLTDAVAELARQGAPVWAVELKGRRYDCGDKIGYVNAFVDAALGRNDTGPAVRAHLEALGWKAPRAR